MINLVLLICWVGRIISLKEDLVNTILDDCCGTFVD